MEKDFDIATKVLSSRGFKVNLEKSEKPSQSATFCGILIDGKNMQFKPAPSRRPITEATLKSAIQVINEIDCKDRLRKEFRSWHGIANYFNKWLNSEMRSNLFKSRENLKNIDDLTIENLKSELRNELNKIDSIVDLTNRTEKNYSEGIAEGPIIYKSIFRKKQRRRCNLF